MRVLDLGGYASAFCAAAMLAGCGTRSGVPLSPSLAGVAAERTRPSVTYGILHSFGSGSGDGETPYARLLNVMGTLYGTTSLGGAYGVGTVFAITSSRRETVLHSFKRNARDGEQPTAELVNVKGTLYSTTQTGGTSGDGIVFAITSSRKEAVLYSFKGGAGDGAKPDAGLLDIDGTLYGTTAGGGASDAGTVFTITTSGKERMIHSFGAPGDGNFPYAGLINVGGTLYGTTVNGGANGDGTVFSITPSGTESVFYSFKGYPNDGAGPYAGLTNVRGTLYGTTENGGAHCRSIGGCGTVFRISTSGKETVLHSFGLSGDGAIAVAGLTRLKGTLYGTTLDGGKNGTGTVFGIGTDGKGETVLHSFKGGFSDGASPWAALINVNGTLYGTTKVGGAYDYGIVFSITP